MKTFRNLACLPLALIAGLGMANAQQTPDPRVADLAKAGEIRVGLFPPQSSKDPKMGEQKSAWSEVARALATRIGVRVVFVHHPTPPNVIECLKAGACDIIFLPRDDRAADVGDFSAPYMQFEYTLLVPVGSSIRTVHDADRAEIRIAAVRNHASTNTLLDQIKYAKFVYAETPEPTFGLLRSGNAEAMASTRPVLQEFSAQLAGSRVLETYYGANLNRIVVPKGNAGRLAYVNEFVEEAKRSGLVQKAIDGGGQPGITVAPPGDAK
jgi:polar amino acid transport system substrate-binding protein